MRKINSKLLIVIALLALIIGFKVYERMKEYEHRKISEYILTNNCYLLPVVKEGDPKQWQCDTGNWTDAQLIHNALDVPDDRKE